MDARSARSADARSADAWSADARSVAEGSVRSIFFSNDEIEIGTGIGLHLFEPRYRLMVQRAMSSPERRRQIIFLPNFRRYIGAHGDIGALANITGYRPNRHQRDDKSSLPRADVTLNFACRVLVLFHWEEPESGSLHECTFRELPPLLPLFGLLDRLLDDPEQIVAVDLNPSQNALLELKLAAAASLSHEEFFQVRTNHHKHHNDAFRNARQFMPTPTPRTPTTKTLFRDYK